MKVLLLVPMADGQTGPAIKYAFEKLGHEVEAVDAKRHPLLSYSIACGYKPNLVFCSRTRELTDEVAKIKRRFPNAVACVWNVDTRYDINYWVHLFPLIKLVDYHFVPDTATIPRWKGINPNTSWLPQGLQNEIYNRPEKITNEDIEKYSCDVSFAGSIDSNHKNRKDFLDAVKKMGINYKFWGCHGIPRVYNEEHNKMVSLSKINIAISGWVNNGKYTSVRDYKLMGAGGFVLELYRKGIHDIFPLETLICYWKIGDFIEKIKHYLNHEEERKDIAQRAYKWVHENATYTHRMKTALEQMGL